MKVTELIAQMQQSDPQLLSGIPAPQAEALVTAAFKHMNEVLAKTEEGAVNFSGLGRFRIKRTAGAAGGDNAGRTRITFRVFGAREGGAGVGGGRAAGGEGPRRQPGAGGGRRRRRKDEA